MINIDKKYRTRGEPQRGGPYRGGEDVTIMGLDGRGNRPIYGYVGETPTMMFWAVNGKHAPYSPYPSPYDLIEVEEEEKPKFPKLEVGDLVYVTNPYNDRSWHGAIYELIRLSSTHLVLINLITGCRWTDPSTDGSIWGGARPHHVFKLPDVTQKHLKKQILAIGETIQHALFKEEN